ncbi:2-phospho-L-lactate transferase [Halobacteria archaeon AArc-dxtr1]|nr:2-phospho-L-lactate transferase [Halobacteria archaeon AArc-dxtr1]
MITFLSGGTGTPKLLDGLGDAVTADEAVVVANTGDDVELGGLFVCPDVDTLLFQGGEVLDRETWWGIDGDTHETNTELHALAEAADLSEGPQYLPPEHQTVGRRLANWRRFSGVAEFMTIGDRDRAVHITRTSLLDEGYTLSEATNRLADAFDLEIDLRPMSDDPVATLVHTDGQSSPSQPNPMHFQEYWVGHRGEPAVADVEFRGAEAAEPTPSVLEALSAPVIVGPSNPVTSIGPMLSLPGVPESLEETPVVAVSPFLGDEPFSGPAADLMAAVGQRPSTAGLADAYPFADAFVVDEADETAFDRPTVRTDVRIDSAADAERVLQASVDAVDLIE